MPVVTLAFTPAPRYVRTARLVGVTVARRAGVAEHLLDEVRLAIGEACARAVERHRRHGVPDLIQVVIADDGPYTVWVVDTVRSGPGPAADPDEEEADRMADALLAAVVDDLEVRSGADGTQVRMVWPVQTKPPETVG